MTVASISPLEQTVQKTNLWLEELSQDLGVESQQAYTVLRAVLHTLRDRLTVEEASDLGSQLPMLVRGIYYEGWNPAQTPTSERELRPFLERISSEVDDSLPVEAEQAARSVFRLLAASCTAGQVNHVRSNLPGDLKSLWPE